MEATKIQPSTNGVIKIARRGRVKFELEDGKPFELDVIQVYDDWYDLDWSFREIDAEGNGSVPIPKRKEWKESLHAYWQAVVSESYVLMGYPEPPTLSRGESEALLVAITAEVNKIRSFFSPKKEESSSPPSSTEEGSETRFSQ